MSFKFYLVQFFLIACMISSCNTIKDVKTGEEAFEKKQFHRAIDMLTEEYSKTDNPSSKAHKAYLIGKCYDINSEYDAAVSWFESSLNYDDNLQTILALAFAYKKTEDYNAAIRAFTALRDETNEKERFQKEINICKEVSKWPQDNEEHDYELNSFGGNTGFSEYGARLDRTGQVVFVSDRPSELNEGDYYWTGRGFSDIYTASANGTFLELLDYPINTPGNEGPVCFSTDFEEMYFTRCTSENLRDEYCRIYYSYFYSGEWTQPVALRFFKEDINYGNPTLMDRDSILVFSADVNDSDHDLYYAVREPNGWSEAIPMPDYLNSAGDDVFPTTDGDTLYFASDGHPGLGGLDIFKTYLRNDRTFAPPENMKRPINSSDDDFYMTITERSDQGFQGFFSSSRGLVGSDDIISFVATQKAPEDSGEPEEGTEEEEVEQSIYLAITIKGQSVDGSITTLRESDLQLQRNLESIDVDQRNGIYILEVDSLDQIYFKALAPEYLAKTSSVDISAELPDDLSENVYTINKTLVLDPIILNQEIKLENIYYDFEKWDIREDAKPSLNELAQLLKDNPDVKIQLSSHTDCRGDNDFNLDLSQKRAQSAVDYIISVGIAPERITAKGYGEERPAANCLCAACTEEEHQDNRRTTFQIVE